MKLMDFCGFLFKKRLPLPIFYFKLLNMMALKNLYINGILKKKYLVSELQQ